MRRSRWMGIAGAAAVALPLLAADWKPRRRVEIATEPERTPSYWMCTIPPLPKFPRLDRELQVDVAVVGGGFTGLAAAYYLKKLEPSLRVVLLEAQRFGSGASSRNSGGVRARFRGHDPSPSAARGYQLLQTFAETEGIDFDLAEGIPCITLYSAAQRCPNPDLTGDELAREIGSPFYAAAEVSTANWLHPGKLIAGLVEANQRRGTELYEWSPVVRIDRGRSITLHTPGGRVTAQHLVLATNGYTQQLGFARSVLLTMHHRVIVTRPLTPAEWERSGLERWPFRLEAGGYYTHTVRSTPDRRFFYRHVLGHRAFEGTSWAIGEREREIGQRELLQRYPWLAGVPIEYEWHGVTARTADWWPVSGQVDENIYVAAGYNGSGVMPTHFFGFLLAQSILGNPDPDLALLRPPRTHPRLPGGWLRHLAFQGWIEYRRWRGSRTPAAQAESTGATPQPLDIAV